MRRSLFALFYLAIVSGCASDGDSPASCRDVCAHLTSLCDPAPDDCNRTCASMSSETRACVASAASCSAAGSCAGSIADAAPMPSDGGATDGSSEPDAGSAPDAGFPGIQCGVDVCTAGVDACCWIGIDLTCQAPDSCEQSYACDGPEDCPGAECCENIDENPNSSSCQPSCLGYNAGQPSMCHTNADCAAPETCCFTPAFGNQCWASCPG